MEVGHLQHSPSSSFPTLPTVTCQSTFSRILPRTEVSVNMDDLEAAEERDNVLIGTDDLTLVLGTMF